MNEDIVIPIVAILMPLILVPSVMVLRQRARRREWEYRERMKALELGVPVPGTEVWIARVAIAMGAVMPVAVFAIAWLVSVTTNMDEVWLTAAVVGGAGVLGGTRLAIRAIARPSRDEMETRSAEFARRDAKPSFDPDAYDAIVRHG